MPLQHHVSAKGEPLLGATIWKKTGEKRYGVYTRRIFTLNPDHGVVYMPSLKAAAQVIKGLHRRQLPNYALPPLQSQSKLEAALFQQVKSLRYRPFGADVR